MHDHVRRREKSGEDDCHLEYLSVWNRFCSAGYGVKNYHTAGEKNRPTDVDSEDRRNDNGRRIDGDAGWKAALQKK